MVSIVRTVGKAGQHTIEKHNSVTRSHCPALTVRNADTNSNTEKEVNYIEMERRLPSPEDPATPPTEGSEAGEVSTEDGVVDGAAVVSTANKNLPRYPSVSRGGSTVTRAAIARVESHTVTT